MALFIKRLTLFLCLVSGCYYFFIILVGHFAPVPLQKNLVYKLGGYGFMHSRINEFNNKAEDYDIVALGSSHLYRSLDSRIFNENGIKLFNFGSSSQTLIQSNYLLKTHVKNKSIQTLVIEVNPSSFKADGVESTLDIISNDQNSLASVQMALKTPNIKVFNTALFAISRDILGLNDSFKEQNKVKSDTYISGGFVAKELTFNSPSTQLKTANSTKPIFTNNKQFSAFQEILKWTEENDINLILFQAPVTETYYYNQGDNDYFDSTMTTFAPYYNFNKLVELDDSLHFYDSHHLNQNGVNKFVPIFISTALKQ